jgi:hypothetical protein
MTAFHNVSLYIPGRKQTEEGLRKYNKLFKEVNFIGRYR